MDWPEGELQSDSEVGLRSGAHQGKVEAFVLNGRRDLYVALHQPIDGSGDVIQSPTTKKNRIVVLSAIADLNLLLSRKPIGAPGLYAIALAADPAAEDV